MSETTVQANGSRIQSGQAPSHVVLVRPSNFHPNPATAADNSFQALDDSRDHEAISRAAYEEVTELAKALTDIGATVHLFDDHGTEHPDSVFPNNWFSTHSDDRVAIYPMFSPNRRGERRNDVLEMLRRRYRVADVTDFSSMESEELFLEGTGAMVIDHIDRTAYIARSNRADERAVSHVCREMGLQPVIFTTADTTGAAIYHTNVMMSVATTFALVGLEALINANERQDLERRLVKSGRVIFDLTQEQIANFAGNAIEVQGAAGRYLILSQRAFDSLRQEQIVGISAHCTLLPVAVPTIELAGGSVRCMIAGIHLHPTERPIDISTSFSKTSYVPILPRSSG